MPKARVAKSGILWGGDGLVYLSKGKRVLATMVLAALPLRWLRTNFGHPRLGQLKVTALGLKADRPCCPRLRAIRLGWLKIRVTKYMEKETMIGG